MRIKDDLDNQTNAPSSPAHPTDNAPPKEPASIRRSRENEDRLDDCDSSDEEGEADATEPPLNESVDTVISASDNVEMAQQPPDELDSLSASASSAEPVPIVCNAIAFWFELHLDESTTLSTSPYANDGLRKGPTWQQAVQYVEERSVRAGETLDVVASHDTYVRHPVVTCFY